MSPSHHQIIGCSECVDWRPITFVDLHPFMACALCNVVSKLTVVLECCHALCEMCYENVLEGEHQCPIDGELFEEVNTGKLLVKAQQIGKQQAHCFNLEHGCDFVGSVQEVKEHFFNVCTFHAVTCNRCSAKVLRSEIVNHYVQQCVSLQVTADQTAPKESADAALELGRKIDASLGIMADRLSAMEDHLNRYAVTIETAKDTVLSNASALKEVVERQEQDNRMCLGEISDKLNVITQQGEELTKYIPTVKRVFGGIQTETSTATNVKKDCGGDNASGASDTDVVSRPTEDLFVACERLSSIKEMFSEVRSLVRYIHGVFYFHVADFADFEKESPSDEVVRRYSDSFILSGYSAKLVVRKKTFDDGVYLGVFLCICKGRSDSLLKWPFALPYVLSLVHPTDDKKNKECNLDVLDYVKQGIDSFNKPQTAMRCGVGNPRLYKLQDVAKEGFVHDNAITVGVRIDFAS